MKRVLFILMAVLIAGSFGSQALAKVTNQQLVIGTAQEFENLNPLISQMQVTSYSQSFVLRNMMTLDADANWVPMMTKQIPSFENGGAEFITEDGVKKIKATWELLENTKWGDGTPVTGYDVQFTWMVGKNENVAVGGRSQWTDVERIEVDNNNPKKMVFIEKATWDFYQKPQFDIIPKHIEGPVFQKYKNEPQGYEKNTKYSTDPTNPGLYNGPYLVEEIKLGSHIKFKPNPHFFGKKPNIQNILIKLIPNTAALEANLISENIKMITPSAMSFDQALAFEKRAKKSKLPYKVHYRTGLIYEHIDLQLRNPILSDLKVRRALVYGLNRQKLVDTIYEGKLQPAVHDVSPVDPWFTDDPKKIVTYEYSRKKAGALLDEAGWILNRSDGYRYKDGKKFTLQIMTTSGNAVRQLVQVFLQEEWKKIGLDLTIKNEPPRVYFGETVRKSLYTDMAMFAWFSSPDSNPRSGYHKDSIPTEENGYSGQNAPHWVNDTVSDLVDEMDTIFDAQKRLEQRHKMLYEYTNDIPVIPLYYRVNITVTPDNIENYTLSGTQFNASLFSEYWNFK